MNLDPLFKDIEGLRYVVMRNWETLPPAGDIDFFVHHDDYDALKEACRQHLDEQWYDIRTFGDGYFPEPICNRLISRREKHGDIWIPNPRAHFVSLYYHNLVHKGDGRYDEKLKELFLQAYPPSVPDDEGVGFHIHHAAHTN